MTRSTEGGVALPLRARSAVLLTAVSALGLAGFLWPLLARPGPVTNEHLSHAGDAPWIFAALLPLLLGVLLAELSAGTIDSKAIAVLGVLAACGAVLRLPSGGITGFEPLWFLLIPSGRVLGRGFGLVLGALTMFASALLTGGVGPWLPFQMFGAAWVGFFAGCLPPARGRAEVALLAAYGVVAGLAFGLLINLWFWPFAVSPGGDVSFVPGGAVVDNLRRYWAFHVSTSLGWDIPRAFTNAVLVLVLGRPVLRALRRAARRAAFGAPVTFEPHP